MDVFLLRHADANTVATTDDERRLSEKGVAQAEKVGRFCVAHEIAPQLIVTSPIRRADETARIVAQHLGCELVTGPWLACGMHPEAAMDEIAAFNRFERIMIVGHEPDFSEFAAQALGLSGESQVHIRKASLTHLHFPVLRAGLARLEFAVPCRLMDQI
ncbi:MAG: histidine phosphatase family protein [Chthoniobacteraceae bacterium]